MQEEQKYEDIVNLFKAVRTGLITILGLDIMPIEDEDGRLRRPKENEYMPLSMMIANESIMNLLSERTEALKTQDDVDDAVERDEDLSVEELDSFIQEDIVFLDDPEELKKRLAMAAPESKWVAKNVIKPLPVTSEEAAAPKLVKKHVVIESV